MRHLSLTAVLFVGCGPGGAVVEVRETPYEATSRAEPSQRGSTDCATHVDEAAALHRLDPGLIRAVIHVESRGRSTAVSHRGARGCMQLIASTARAVGVEDPLDARQNVLGGAAYLRRMLDYFDGSVVRALGAYNSGPGRVRKEGEAWAAIRNDGYVCNVLAAWDTPRGRRLHGEGCAPRSAGARHLRRLHPELRRRAQTLVRRARAAGVEVRLISGYRRPRGKPSWHHFGLAFDVNLVGRKTMKDALRHYEADRERWETVGRIAGELDLVWGAPWRRTEVFHFEWHPGYPAAITPKRARELTVRAGGDTPEMVWKLFDTTG